MPVFKFSHFELDTEQRLLLRDGVTVPLTLKAYELLLLLIQNNGRVMSKDELLSTVWPEIFIEESTLAQYIFTLRKALDEKRDNRHYIVNIPKRGYRFTAEVEEISGAVDQTAAVTPSEEKKSEVERPESAIGEKPFTALAALPLTNVSNDPNAEYLADGITGSIISNLSQLPSLRVMARSTVFRYKDTDLTLQAIGQELDVQAVLAGRILQVADSLIIKMELIDVTTGWLLWGEQYTRQVSNILEVEEEIARQVSEELRLKLGDGQQPPMKNYTENTQAYQLYLKGRYYLNQKTGKSCEVAVDFFTQAIKLDENYALAYCGLADAYILLDLYGLLPPWKIMPLAKSAALKALEIDDSLAEAHTSLGCVKMDYDRDWVGAEMEFQLAIKLNPNCALAHSWYSLYLMAMGRTEEALEESKSALNIEPFDVKVNEHLGWYYLYSHQYDKAINQLQETLKLDPNFNLARILLGRAYEKKGMFAEAIAEFQRASRLDNNPSVLGLIGHAHARAGERDEALNILAEMSELSKRRYVPPYTVALVHAGLDHREETLDELENAVAASNQMLSWLKYDPDFDNLRSHPRFAELLNALKLAG